MLTMAKVIFNCTFCNNTDGNIFITYQNYTLQTFVNIEVEKTKLYEGDANGGMNVFISNG